MRLELLGWPDDDVTLSLDHRQFSYAGKFRMSNTGKAIVADGETVLGAAAFNRDRTESTVLWIRYVTVRSDRRGEGLGTRLLTFVREAGIQRGFDRLRIAVNNPYAYQASYRAGFGYTGRKTGIAELVLEHPTPDGADYRAGLVAFADRGDLPESAARFVERRMTTGPPDPIRPAAPWTERDGPSEG